MGECSHLVDLQTMNGTINVDSVDINELQVSTMNGKVTLQYFDAREVHAETANGNVLVDTVNVDTRFNVTVMNGNIILQDASFQTSKLRTENGKVVLENINTVEKDGLDLEIVTTNGRVSLINVYVDTVDVSTINGDIYYNNDEVFIVDYSKQTINGDSSGNMD